MTLPFPEEVFRGDYIRGKFRKVLRGRALLSEDPGDLDRPVGRFRSDPSMVDAAVRAAREAFPAWRSLPVEKRAAFLRRFQKILRREAEGLAVLISRETGKPLAESRAEAAAMSEKVDVTLSEALPLILPQASPFPGGARIVTRYVPLGVVAVVGPFNVPGHLPNGQIVPALLAGNTVVFKPSEWAPFTGQKTAELWDRAGLPPGVMNLVQGDGETGRALTAHPDVNAVFFTGSVETGRRVAAAAASDPSRLVALEMGGKNAALVFPDAPLEETVREVVQGAFATSGQRCSSTSRLFLHHRAAGKFLKPFLAAVDALETGYFTDEPDLGPLISSAAVERFLKAQKTARRLGYEPLREGKRFFPGRRGHYVSPSVHLWEGMPRFRRPDYWDEEIFAPDIAVYILKDEDEMTALHNASRFGLAASVFTRDGKRFRALRERLEAGVVHWNRTTAMTPGRLPFGGAKASGNHRPAGLHMIQSCVRAVGSVENPGGVSRKSGGGK